MTLWVGFEARAVDDGEICGEIVEFFQLRTAQHGADKQTVPRQLGDHAHVKTVGRIGAAIKVFNEKIFAFHMLKHIGVKNIKFGRVHRLVVFPPDRVFHGGGAHNEFVFWGPASVFACGHKESAAFAKRPFFAFQGFFDERRLKKVVIDMAKPCDALVVKCESRVHASGCHSANSLPCP